MAVLDDPDATKDESRGGMERSSGTVTEALGGQSDTGSHLLLPPLHQIFALEEFVEHVLLIPAWRRGVG